MWHGHPDLYMNKLDEILKTTDDSDIGYFVEADLKYPDNKKEKIKKFPFAPQNKVNPNDNYDEYVKKPNKCTKVKRILCNWPDKKICLLH